MKKRILVSQLIALSVLILAKPNDWCLFGTGMLIMLVGQMIRVLASSAIVKSSTLTVTGPYAAVRNPLYLGTAFMALGLLVALSNLEAPLRTAMVWMVTITAFTFIYRVQIQAEEKFLLDTYGERFTEYRSRVNSIFPRFRAIAEFMDLNAYSFEVFKKNKEWRGFMGMAVIGAIVAARIKYGF